MEKVISKRHGDVSLVASFNEINRLEVYAKSILRTVETLQEYPDSENVQAVHMEMAFSRTQAMADYFKAASKRLHRKPRRHDHLNLVELASETVDLT